MPRYAYLKNLLSLQMNNKGVIYRVYIERKEWKLMRCIAYIFGVRDVQW